MKRLNHKTGKPFRYGDVGDDGKIFFAYNKKAYQRNGYFKETWQTVERFSTLQKQNRERMVQHRRNFRKNQRGKVNAYSAKRNAAQRKRTPKWIGKSYLKEIEEFYVMAKELEKIFPWKQEVDHIIPKHGKYVSGFHVPWNLQILSEKANREKSNKYDAEQIEPPSLSEGYYHNGKVYTQLGIIPAARVGQDDDDAHHHCGADARKDADHRTQEGGGDSVGQRSEEVVTFMPFKSFKSDGFTQLSFEWPES